MLEVPHIMVLISDPARAVIEPLRDRKESLEVVYDTDLMLGGGHLTGYLVSSEKDISSVLSAIEGIYSTLDKSNPLLFAMGDGNHSLASAKSCWEDIKQRLSAAERETHPARYALVEIENIFDPGLLFEPIHRAFFSISKKSFDDILSHHARKIEQETIDSLEEANRLLKRKKNSFILVSGSSFILYTLDGTEKSMPAWTMQSVIDEMLGMKKGEVDYIHGIDTVVRHATEGAIGVILPDISKETFFQSKQHDRAIPRKTISNGHANEKRYYIEARRIR